MEEIGRQGGFKGSSHGVPLGGKGHLQIGYTGEAAELL